MSNAPAYSPATVWTWNKKNGGRFASINRPVAGPAREKVLPAGEHPFQRYSRGTPNSVKVSVMLEELLALGHEGAEYDAWMIRSFMAISSTRASSISAPTPKSPPSSIAAAPSRSASSCPA